MPQSYYPGWCRRKRKHRKVKWLSQDHADRKCQNHNSNPRCPAPESCPWFEAPTKCPSKDRKEIRWYDGDLWEREEGQYPVFFPRLWPAPYVGGIPHHMSLSGKQSFLHHRSGKFRYDSYYLLPLQLEHGQVTQTQPITRCSHLRRWGPRRQRCRYHMELTQLLQ